MAAPPPPAPPILNTTLALHRTLMDFLTVAIHTILYIRELYPHSTFLTTRAYNLPVHQNRHPKVCEWINESIKALEPQISANAVKRVVVVIYSPDLKVLERFLFDISRFPVVDHKERFTEFEGDAPGVADIVDIEEQLRAKIRKLDYLGGKMKPLPKDCTFTLSIELRDEADPPIGHPQPWVPSEPSLQISKKGKEKEGADIGGVKSSPIGLVEAGDFVLEAWAEEGAAKFEMD
ncbi:hypothetical protein HYALB_00006708 [Hymenoscyphus albidus]|uniref:HORMA domain-containing protein n=1 Tax=Hymenoscyphus albidus TaxID=595503 RepID=A0A9N9LKU0_9HELO|nr:hypothetical protein HYALB_00006708 [Hymenoscyphus albidus]